MRSIRVCFLWHMHQPFYKDLVTGEYRLPWVRMHALKDYYGMVRLLDEFEHVHQTFNLVPSLVAQIEDYAAGTARDPFLDTVETPAPDLTTHERLTAIHYLFQANETNLVRRYPRYQQLLEQVRGAGGDTVHLAAQWSTQDFLDLQVLSQLAWFDEYWLSTDATIAALASKGTAFSAHDKQQMLAKQRELLRMVLPAYSAASAAGKIEISTSPFYHPISPLLCDTNIGRVSDPNLLLPPSGFRYPEDAEAQLFRALDFMQARFAKRPVGVWPSEGSVSHEVLTIASRLGVRWTASGEGVLSRSLDASLNRDQNGTLDADSADRLYRCYRYEQEGSEIDLLFRDHSLSDLIGFVYAGMDAKQAAQHFIAQIKNSASAVLARGRDAIVPVVLDGENAWEHFHQSGREFLRTVYSLLEADPQIECCTISEALERTPPEHFGHLSHIMPGSWINANFNIWIGASEDNLSWERLAEARSFYQHQAAAASSQQRALAMEELLIAEGSDWNWWYGPEHHTANDRDFDELYRQHLANVYRALGKEPPQNLDIPIAGAAHVLKITPQSQYIRPAMKGPGISYFDWLGAASYFASPGSVMHSAQRRLAAMYAGFDERFLYARLDFLEGVAPEQAQCRLDIETTDAQQKICAASRVNIWIEAGRVSRWLISRAPGHQNHRPAASLNGGEYEESAARLTNVLEVRIQQAALRALRDSVVRLRFTLVENLLPIDSLPREGWMTLRVMDPEALQEFASQPW